MRGALQCACRGQRVGSIYFARTLQLFDVMMEERLLRRQTLQQVSWQRRQLPRKAGKVQKRRGCFARCCLPYWRRLVIHLHSFCSSTRDSRLMLIRWTAAATSHAKHTRMGWRTGLERVGSDSAKSELNLVGGKNPCGKVWAGVPSSTSSHTSSQPVPSYATGRR